MSKKAVSGRMPSISPFVPLRRTQNRCGTSLLRDTAERKDIPSPVLWAHLCTQSRGEPRSGVAARLPYTRGWACGHKRARKLLAKACGLAGLCGRARVAARKCGAGHQLELVEDHQRQHDEAEGRAGE